MANSFFSWPDSLTRFVRFDAARAEEVNAALDEVSAGFDDVEIKTDAAIKLPDGEAAATLPAPLSRANKFLAFSASGDPVVIASATPSSAVDKLGDTMLGDLTLVGDPTSALMAAPKQYVDAVLPTQTGKSGKFLVTNGSTTSWSGSDAATSSTATDSVTMTASSATVVAIATTDYGKSVTLPDATTLYVGRTCVITNTGSYPVALRDSTGVMLRSILPDGVARCSLADTSTAAGVWAVEGSGLSEVHVTRASAVSSGHYGPPNSYTENILKLTSTSWIIFTSNGTNYYATHFDASTNALGTPTSIGSGASLGVFCRAYATTSGFLVWCTTQLVAATVSGATVTPGSAVTHSFGTNGTNGGYPDSFCQLNTDKFVGTTWSSTQPQAIAFTVSTNVITAGSATNIGATVTGASQNYIIIKRSTSQAIVHVQNGSTNHTWRHITVGDDRVVTYNSISATEAVYPSSPAYSYDTDKWAYLNRNGNNYYFETISLSGTVITLDQPYSIADGSTYIMGADFYPNSKRFYKISNSLFYFHCYNGADPYTVRHRIGSTAAMLTTSSEGVGVGSSAGNAYNIAQNDTPNLVTFQAPDSTTDNTCLTYGILDNSFPSNAINYTAKLAVTGANPDYCAMANMTNVSLLYRYRTYGSTVGGYGMYLYRPGRAGRNFYEVPFVPILDSASGQLAQLKHQVYNNKVVINGYYLYILEVAA